MFTSLALQAMLVLVPAPRDKDNADKGPGYLGVTYVEDDGGVGFVVTHVHENSPAQRAGIRVGDHLLMLAGKKVEDISTFVRDVVRMRPGTVVEAQLLRDGAKKTVKIKIGVRPEDFPHPLPPPVNDDIEQQNPPPKQ